MRPVRMGRICTLLVWCVSPPRVSQWNGEEDFADLDIGTDELAHDVTGLVQKRSRVLAARHVTDWRNLDLKV